MAETHDGVEEDSWAQEVHGEAQTEEGEGDREVQGVAARAELRPILSALAIAGATLHDPACGGYRSANQRPGGDGHGQFGGGDAA